MSTYPACPVEDSPGPCYWDATVSGNGLGNSFLVHADQSVEYVEYVPGSYPYALPLDALADPVLVVTLGFIGALTVCAGVMLRVLSTLGK